MAVLKNMALVIYGKIIVQDVCKTSGIWKNCWYRNNNRNDISSMIQKSRLSTSAYLKNDKHIVKSFCKDINIPKNVSFHDFIWKKSAELHSDKIALVDGVTNENYTYEDARSLSIKFGNSLRKLGFQKDDVLAVFLPNCPEYLLSVTGTIGAGGIVTTVNPTYTATEVSRQLDMSNASIIFTKSNMLPITTEAIKNCHKPIRIILLDKKQPDVIYYKDLIEDGEPEWSKEVHETIDNENVCLLPYSSGTTGLPKGVMLTAQNIISNISQMVYAKEINFIEETTVTYQPKTICVLPMFHAFGMGVTSLPTLHAGGQIITLPNFEPTSFINAMERYQPTFMHLAPPLVGFCANSPLVESKHLESLKYIMVGAAPVGETLVEAFKKKAPTVHFREGYGMTELSPVVTLTIVDIFKPGSCGVLLPNTQAKVVDLKTGQSVGQNETGELCFKGPQVMKGYLNNEKATKSTIKDGWLYSGDIAFYDELERFYIVDRLKELIKVKGFQVPPAELEDLIRGHPLTADVAVIGIPDAMKGELPRAYVVLKPNLKESEEECKNRINDYVNEHVTQYKRLAGGIEFIDAIPKSPAGKILRKDLKAKFLSRST